MTKDELLAWILSKLDEGGSPSVTDCEKAGAQSRSWAQRTIHKLLDDGHLKRVGGLLSYGDQYVLRRVRAAVRAAKALGHTYGDIKEQVEDEFWPS